MNTQMLRLLAAPALAMGCSTAAHAASVSFSGGGDSITLTVSDLPAFTITESGGNTYQFGIIFAGVYSVPPLEIASGYSSEPLQISVNGTEMVSTFNFAYAGDKYFDASSFMFFIGTEVFGTLNIGDTVKISDFSLTFDNDNMDTPYVLPDSVAGASIYLSDGPDPISNTATAMIPEPSAALLSGLGVLALLRRRR